MNYELITTEQQLEEYCDRVGGEPLIAFDTEFVSEDFYRPQLCLIQVAAGPHLAVIDPLAIPCVDRFWELLAEPGRESVVHAGREEFRFCRLAIQRRPSRWFDIQIAAGLVGLEYPAAYSTLIHKLIGVSLRKGETRTDWRRRPLTTRQLDYAVQDVQYLLEIRQRLGACLTELSRTAWLDDELACWQQSVEEAEVEERWNRVSGISGLSARSLAIVRELWRWREKRAQETNRPARRVFRDDLLVELARRGSADPQRIQAVRGMERRGFRQVVPELARCVQIAMELPEDDLPRRPPSAGRTQLNLLIQFLSAALHCICRKAQVAPAIVGTVQDVRDLVSYRFQLDRHATQVPALLTGWRAEVVGSALDELLDGRLAMRIVDPLSDQPLSFEK